VIAPATMAVTSAATTPRLLIAGDSWGSDIAGGGFFDRVLRKHQCNFTSTNIAIGGTTTASWAAGRDLDRLKKEAAVHDYIWITLGGNDAIAEMPACARKGKTAQECGDELMEVEKKNYDVILNAVHDANPAARVVGFGYDVMFGGVGCTEIAESIFPQCWKGVHNASESRTCFNTQFVRIQELWEGHGRTYSWVDPINILGTCQAAAEYPGVTVGHPDLSKWGPGEYFPTALGCIHPSVTGSPAGADIVMEEMHKQYFAKKLECAA